MNPTRRMHILSICAGLVLAGLASWASAAPNTMTHQGVVTDDSGVPVADGVYTMTFLIYETETSGSALWGEWQNVSVTGGVYSVVIGEGTPLGGVFDANLFAAPEPRWLEVTFNGQLLSPRHKLTSVAYALQAQQAQEALSVVSNSVTTAMLRDLAVDETKLADDAVVGAKILDGSITTDDIQDNSITAADISGGPDSGLDADTVDGEHAAAFAVATHNHDESYYTKTQVDVLKQRIEALETTVSQLTVLLQGVSRAGDDIVFSGVNVHIVDDTGDTGGTPNGLGNLIVGYNEPRGDGTDDRSGSHNLVVGSGQSFSSYGGFVAGSGNTVAAPHASVSGGKSNTARGYASSVSGGQNNAASGESSSVSGGGGPDPVDGNLAVANYSSILGGLNNLAGDGTCTWDGGLARFVCQAGSDPQKGTHSAVSGGQANAASGSYAAVNGGWVNTAGGDYAAVNGGKGNTADGTGSSVSGGTSNWASGDNSSASGGAFNRAEGSSASVSGGFMNEAIANRSSILGGWANFTGDAHCYLGGGGLFPSLTCEAVADPDPTVGLYSTVSGGRWNIASGDTASSGGGYMNEASGLRAVASGGEGNLAGGDHASVSGGSYNKSSGDHASVSGGSFNESSGVSSSVSGGSHNVASGTASSVSGGGGGGGRILESGVLGDGNEAFADYSSILGGSGNWVGVPIDTSAPPPWTLPTDHTVGESAAVGGGQNNTASGLNASVSGGRNNRASGAYSSVAGGGSDNPIHGNHAYANYSSILGGIFNITGSNNPELDPDHTVAERSTISGGDTNRTSGTSSTVSGGVDNHAFGIRSTVSGGAHLTETSNEGYASPNSP